MITIEPTPLPTSLGRALDVSESEALFAWLRDVPDEIEIVTASALKRRVYDERAARWPGVDSSIPRRHRPGSFASDATRLIQRHLERVGQAIFAPSAEQAVKSNQQLPIAHLERIEVGIDQALSPLAMFRPDQQLVLYRTDTALGRAIALGAVVDLDVLDGTRGTDLNGELAKTVQYVTALDTIRCYVPSRVDDETHHDPICGLTGSRQWPDRL